MVRALAGDSTMTSLCATAWLLILCPVIAARGPFSDYLGAVSGPDKVARPCNGPANTSIPARPGPEGAEGWLTGLLGPTPGPEPDSWTHRRTPSTAAQCLPLQLSHSAA